MCLIKLMPVFNLLDKSKVVLFLAIIASRSLCEMYELIKVQKRKKNVIVCLRPS